MKQEDAALILGAKSTNPKDIQGFKKVPFHLFPMTALAVGAIQFLDGAGKYGRENYRKESVVASVYYDAAMRHLNDWYHGEERTTDSMLRHLGGALASIAILVDAEVNGKLIDDRCYTNNYASLMTELNGEVLRLGIMHADKHPHHYSKLDAVRENQEEWDAVLEKANDFVEGWFFEEEYFEFVEMFNHFTDPYSV